MKFAATWIKQGVMMLVKSARWRQTQNDLCIIKSIIELKEAQLKAKGNIIRTLICTIELLKLKRKSIQVIGGERWYIGDDMVLELRNH